MSYPGLLSIFADFALFQRPLGHLSALRTRRNILPVRCGHTHQTALAYLEVDGSKQAHVCQDVDPYFIYYFIQISIVRT